MEQENISDIDKKSRLVTVIAYVDIVFALISFALAISSFLFRIQLSNDPQIYKYPSPVNLISILTAFIKPIILLIIPIAFILSKKQSKEYKITKVLVILEFIGQIFSYIGLFF